MQNAKGFGVLGVFIFVVLIAAMGLVGWRVYQVEDQQINSGIQKPATPYQSKKIVAVGDIACDVSKPPENPNTCQQDATYSLTQKIKPDVVLGLGDLQYSDGALDKFQNSFAKSWGNLTDIFYPSPGNHEYATPGATGYFEYFTQNPPAHPPVDVGRGYYSFDLGEWHVVSLNSNCSEIGGCGAEAEQLKWLDQDLENNSRACTIAFWHHPRFTSGEHAADTNPADTDSLWAKLFEHKADIVLNGHDHLYERFASQTPAGQADSAGIRQFTVGTGGRSLYEKQADTANSEKLIDDSYGVLAMTLDEERYSWEFLSISGETLDSGNQGCVI